MEAPPERLSGFMKDCATPEAIWRERPQPAKRSPASMCKLTISRWVGTVFKGPLEVHADHEDDYHTLSICNRRSDADLIIGGRVVWRGKFAPDPFLLTGPRQSRWEAVFRNSYDTLRVYISQSFLAECHAEIFGRASSGAIQLFQAEALHDNALRQLANILILLQDSDEQFDPSFLESVGIAFTSRLLRVYCPQATMVQTPNAHALAPWRLKLAVDFIEDSLAQPIGLAELSELVGLSRMHFAAQFKLATGIPPYAYILRRRIERAQQLLACSQHSAIEIATILGFASQAHFTTAFKKIVGDTPVRWRLSRGDSNAGWRVAGKKHDSGSLPS